MFDGLRINATGAGKRLNDLYLADEAALVRKLRDEARCSAEQRAAIEVTAARLVTVMRRDRAEKSGLDAFLNEYDLSSAEGVLLMCLAEALLRIPDADTADDLIADRLGAGNWKQHLGESESLFVNASTWGLMLTGTLFRPGNAFKNPVDFFRALVGRLGEPVVRTAMLQAMRIMAEQFVMGRTIDDAVARSRAKHNAGYRYSFDMLGEAALTGADAERYFDSYRSAIAAIGIANSGEAAHGLTGPGISIKLSALSPRFEYSQYQRAIDEIEPRLLALVHAARQAGVSVTVDAEEAARLELTLEIFRRVLLDDTLAGWDGFGLAVQAYQRRARGLIDWLADLAVSAQRRIPVRLVKGAYWDSEIKLAQEQGLASYPVFTRKVNTDVSYLACARALFAADALVPQFATHNAHTVGWLLHTAPKDAEFEFQRLHGMGEALYDELLADNGLACRVYAPVGAHEDLLPYLVRRLLENGANTSFVNRIVQEDQPVEHLVTDPGEAVDALAVIENPRIADPTAMYEPARRNSAGLNLADLGIYKPLADAMQSAAAKGWHARPLIDGKAVRGKPVPSLNPANRHDTVGTVEFAGSAQVEQALASAAAAFASWQARPATERAAILRRAADAFESNRPELLALCIREAGKTIAAANSEVREAVDFLRYYAAEAERLMGVPRLMPGPTGERNELSLTGRGVFVCISPWNFPLAIFTGQVAAALVTGNSVIAKPAEQTGLIAFRAVQLLHSAGVPVEALQFLPGTGDTVGAALVGSEQVAGVAFTGSTQVALAINRALAARAGPIAPLIAETGGQNAMLVDSTALPEQVVRDACTSAFDSAGQRCSALRILLLQDEICDRVLELLRGHLVELRVGDPAQLDTDIGPVIDDEARDALLAHRAHLLRQGRLVAEGRLDSASRSGSFVAPLAVEIDDVALLKDEHFGPVLHIVRFAREQMNDIIDAVAESGYGLTFGIQSRIENRALAIARTAPAGNIYVNRNMIGAAVGVQPFGGRGRSGTGPKAGGPGYLPRFCSERTITVNTAAIGGNATLLAANEDEE